MKRIYIMCLFFAGLVIYSCTKDDFCYASNTSPKLNIGFYSKTNNDSIKPIDSILIVWAKNKEVLKDFNKTGVNKITLPLNTLDSSTTYNIAYKNGNDTIISNFKISYKTKEEYVSRSCGYRIVYEKIKIENNTTQTNWIHSFTPDNLDDINNQDSTHVKMFH